MRRYIIVLAMLFATSFINGQSFVINDSTSSEIDIGENYLVEIILPDLNATQMSILTYDNLHGSFVLLFVDGVSYSVPLQNLSHAVNLKPSVIYSLTGKIKLKFNIPETTEKIGSYKLRSK